jgi:hypothetical protein
MMWVSSTHCHGCGDILYFGGVAKSVRCRGKLNLNEHVLGGVVPNKSPPYNQPIFGRSANQPTCLRRVTLHFTRRLVSSNNTK